MGYKAIFHNENTTAVEWYFKNTMKDGRTEEFDGVSLVEWNDENKIILLKEFGCNINNYDPYNNGCEPEFKMKIHFGFDKMNYNRKKAE